MASIAYELTYLGEAIDSLESYLLSDEIFWSFPIQPPPGEPIYPALTLGGILLTQKRLEGRRLSLVDQSQYLTLVNQLRVIQSRWRSAWVKKAAAEFNARLTQWRNFIEDYQRDPSGNTDRYAYEVRLRVMLELLDDKNPFIPGHLHDLLDSLDIFIKNRILPGSFVWDVDYHHAFPENRYPYLFGELMSDEIDLN